MKKAAYDIEYNSIVNDILNNEEFLKMKNFEHHGITRYDHSLKISYFSYRIAKFLVLDKKCVARAALLHDFFDSYHVKTFKDSVVLTFTHPKHAVTKANEFFEINTKEKDIIKTHMFPVALKYVPKYAESWLVDIVDKAVGSVEFLRRFRYELSYASNISLLFVLNFLR